MNVERLKDTAQELVPVAHLLAGLLTAKSCCNFHAFLLSIWFYEALLQELGLSQEATIRIGSTMQDIIGEEVEEIFPSLQESEH